MPSAKKIKKGKTNYRKPRQKNKQKSTGLTKGPCKYVYKYFDYTVPKLRKVAKAKNLEGYTGLKKAQLVHLIAEHKRHRKKQAKRRAKLAPKAASPKKTNGKAAMLAQIKATDFKLKKGKKRSSKAALPKKTDAKAAMLAQIKAKDFKLKKGKKRSPKKTKNLLAEILKKRRQYYTSKSEYSNV